MGMSRDEILKIPRRDVMKKQIVKTLLCLGLTATMLFGSVGTAFAEGNATSNTTAKAANVEATGATKAADKKISLSVKIDDCYEQSYYSEPTNYIRVSFAGGDGYDGKLTLYRSTKKDSGFVEVDSMGQWGYGSTDYFYDSNALLPGTTYYYYVKYDVQDYDYYEYYDEEDDEYYTESYNITGSAVSPVVSVKMQKPIAVVNAYYEDGKVRVNVGKAEMSGAVSYFKLYRSTKKSKGYKEIAVIPAKDSANYIDSSVDKNATYYYKAKAVYYSKDAKKEFAGAFSECEKVKTLLAEIENLRVNQTSKKKAKVSWNKVNGADGYDIFVKEQVSGDAYKKVATTKKTSVNISIADGSDYYVQVRAYKNENGKTHYENMSTTSLYTTVLSSPKYVRETSTTVKKTGSTYSVTSTLTWEKVYGAKSYKISYWDSKTGTYKTLATTKKNKIKVTRKNLTSRPYYYITAVKGKEESSSTSIYSELNKVTGVKASATKDGVKISWKPVSGAMEYNVYRRPAGAKYGYGVWVGDTKDTSLVCQAPKGVAYEYFVTAYNTDLWMYSRESVYRSEAYGNTLLPVTAKCTWKVGKASISAVKNTAKKTMQVTIKASSDQPEAVEYIVYRSTNKKSGYKKVGVVKANKINQSKNTLIFTDKKAAKGKTYYYKVDVKIKNSSGIEATSGMSSAVKAKCKK